MTYLSFRAMSTVLKNWNNRIAKQEKLLADAEYLKQTETIKCFGVDAKDASKAFYLMARCKIAWEYGKNLQQQLKDALAKLPNK